MGKGYVILPNVFAAHKGVAIKKSAAAVLCCLGEGVTMERYVDK
jgi:hypothetical protein